MSKPILHHPDESRKSRWMPAMWPWEGIILQEGQNGCLHPVHTSSTNLIPQRGTGQFGIKKPQLSSWPSLHGNSYWRGPQCRLKFGLITRIWRYSTQQDLGSNSTLVGRVLLHIQIYLATPTREEEFLGRRPTQTSTA